MKAFVFPALFFVFAAGGAAAAAEPMPIVIDAGHGGKDRGALIRKRSEAVIVLAIAQEMRAELSKDAAFAPVLTRSSDTFVALSERVRRAVDARGKALISLHMDNVRDRTGKGAILFIFGRNRKIPKGPPREPGEPILPDPPKSQVRASRRLADQVAKSLRASGIKVAGYVDIGGFAVLKSPDIPSVLIEMGNMRDEGEASAFAEPAYQRKVAVALNEGIRAFLREEAP